MGVKYMELTYLDMDGVLAQFEQVPHAVERFAVEKGFFKALKPTRFALNIAAHKTNINLESTYILTASPHEAADQDKRDWIKEHLPMLADKVIIVRDGHEKARLAKGGHILIDDYTSNLKFWSEQGGKSIKAINGFNGKTKRYKKYAIARIRVD